MMKALEILFSPATQLNNIQRYSGLYLSRPETVSDHVYQVGIIALTIANNLTEDLDLGKIALKSLVHDLDEALMCDVPRNVKYKNNEILTQFKELEKSGMRDLSKILSFPSLYKLWEESKNSSKEGLLVAISDMLQVSKKVFEEVVILGNLNLVRVADEIGEYLENIANKISQSEFSPESKDYLISIINDVQVEMITLVKNKRDGYERFGIRRA